MEKTMKGISAVTLLLTIIFYVFYKFTDYGICLTLTITFGTIFYHFIIRLMIGMIIDAKMHNKADCQRKRYQVSEFEMKLYRKMQVKKWKNKMPTYSADTFDISKHSWDEIAQASCQSEVVHEINAVFSFLPIIASVWFGDFWVFFFTSVLGAVFDLMFVIMQRFNRTRILKIKRK